MILIKLFFGLILFAIIIIVVFVLSIVLKFGHFINILRTGQHFQPSDKHYGNRSGDGEDMQKNISGGGENTQRRDRDKGEYAQFEELD